MTQANENNKAFFDVPEDGELADPLAPKRLRCLFDQVNKDYDYQATCLRCFADKALASGIAETDLEAFDMARRAWKGQSENEEDFNKFIKFCNRAVAPSISTKPLQSITTRVEADSTATHRDPLSVFTIPKRPREESSSAAGAAAPPSTTTGACAELERIKKMKADKRLNTVLSKQPRHICEQILHLHACVPITKATIELLEEFIAKYDAYDEARLAALAAARVSDPEAEITIDDIADVPPPAVDVDAFREALHNQRELAEEQQRFREDMAVEFTEAGGGAQVKAIMHHSEDLDVLGLGLSDAKREAMKQAAKLLGENKPSRRGGGGTPGQCRTCGRDHDTENCIATTHIDGHHLPRRGVKAYPKPRGGSSFKQRGGNYTYRSSYRKAFGSSGGGGRRDYRDNNRNNDRGRSRSPSRDRRAKR
jgi:ribosomal protein L7/L12